VQISDIHTGSLHGNYQLQKAINLVLEQKPDLIVFTGDLVNNKTEEAFEFEHILNQLKAPFGVFSTLGNHDYGDYASWNSEAEKDKNMLDMIEFHSKIGWNLMLNNHVKIEKENEFFTLIGIENWGGNYNFKKYGDLHKAYENIDKSSFQILLSHDPSHWNLQVTTDFPEIDLTLAGHTHGFQFGIEIPGFKWSPSKYIYPQWAGIYGTEKQKLYVNRGLGCLGYMGRVGIKPEITVIELH
jgi:predicted MPP superfamily phosphohydrolase